MLSLSHSVDGYGLIAATQAPPTFKSARQPSAKTAVNVQETQSPLRRLLQCNQDAASEKRRESSFKKLQILFTQFPGSVK